MNIVVYLSILLATIYGDASCCATVPPTPTDAPVNGSCGQSQLSPVPYKRALVPLTPNAKEKNELHPLTPISKERFALKRVPYLRHNEDNGKVEVRIVGGEIVTPGYLPWQVAVITSSGGLCGGSYVLDSNGDAAVITAAHCTDTTNGSDYNIVFGLHDLYSYINSSIPEFHPVSVTIHEGFNAFLSNDITIMRFSSSDSASIAQLASPICLPSVAPIHGEDVLVSGWGTTSSGGDISYELRYVWLCLIGREECEETGNAGELDDTMICAAEDNRDSCQGDSGGPLVAYRGDQWELVGVVSWGFGCAAANFPGVYTNVFNQKTWILSNL